MTSLTTSVFFGHFGHFPMIGLYLLCSDLLAKQLEHGQFSFWS